MALILANRVQESGTANTTVSFTLTGAVLGFQNFSVVGNGNTTYYAASDAAGNWEVGLGTYSSTGPTLTRTTVYASSNSGSAVTFSGVVNVFVTYPSGKSVNLDATGNVSALGTVSSGTWQGSTVGVAYGGTGVTASAGANSVVLRDANQNIVANSITQSLSVVTSAGGTTVLTVASPHFQILVGTSTQTFQLPDATLLPTGSSWVFDNDSTQNLTVTDGAGSSIDVVPPGGYSTVFLEADGTVAGTWARYGMIPSEVNWGTNSLDLGGSTVVTNGTWQGNTVQPAYGGTGLTTFVGANNALYSTGASTLTAGTLPVAAGGTGLTSFTANGVVYASSSSALTTGSALTFDGTNQFLSASGAGIWFNAYGSYTNGIFTSGGGANDLQFRAGGAQRYLIASTGVSVWSVSGSEQMRLTSTGLGIGTSSPIAQVTAAGNIAAGGTGNNGFQFHSGSPTNSNLEWWWANNQGGSNELRLFYYSGGSFAGTALVIDKSGNLGLGVTPSAWFASSKVMQIGPGASISSRSNTIVEVTSNAFINTSGSWTYQNTGAASLYAGSNGSHQWFTAPSGTAGAAISFTQAMTLDASGNLIVGATSPAGSSQITAYGATNGQIAVQNSTNWSRMVQNAGDLYIDNGVGGVAGNIIFRNSSSTTERARIDASGNLGLGVTPSAWGAFKPALQVGTASLSQIANRAYVTANGFYNGTAWTYIATDFATQYYQQNGTHIWNTASSGTAGNAISWTQAMTLDASGNLGVGTTSPGAKLHVGAGRIFLDQDYQLTWQNAGTNRARIYGDSGNNIVFENGSGNTERARIDSSGNLGLGTSTPGYRLDVYTGVAGVLQRWNTGSVSMLVEADHIGTGNWYLSPQGSATFNVKTGGSTRMTLDASGLRAVSYKETQVALGANNIDLSTGNYFSKTISGTTTLTVSNIPASTIVASFILDLTNGGSATVNWWAGVKWQNGAAPTLTAAGRDVLGFFTYDGGTTWTGLMLAKDVK